jgi:hypothetical protein
MKPEAALVTALARGSAEGVHSAVRAGPDWEKVETLGTLHQVNAICWWMLRNAVDAECRFESSELPAPFVDLLRKSYLHHLLRNEDLLDDLTVLQKALVAHEVEALYFKGPWMALQVYPDPGMRPVNDIDLCVREEQYLAAVAALQSVGWKSHGPLPGTPTEALARNHYRKQLRFAAAGRRIIELHFRLINMGPPASEERWVWEGTRELGVGPCTLRVPGPEAMLLHLLLHANQHGFAMLRFLHDIRWFLAVHSAELDEEMLVHRIRRLRCRASCYYALLLAGELAGADVPGALLDSLRPSTARRAFFTVAWRLRSIRRLETPRRRIEIESPVFYLLEMGRTWEKAYFLGRVIAEVIGYSRLRRVFSKPAPQTQKKNG